MEQGIKELKLLRKGGFKGRHAPILIEKGPGKISQRRNISGTAELIGVTVNHRSHSSRKISNKLQKLFLIMLQILDVNG